MTEKLLQQHYDANQLPMEWLKSGCDLSPFRRSHIEDTRLFTHR
ncbi:hypothetical protein [Trichocoleus sp. FACHB-90]|nr:hypothetical protein [Trichocoleus sp. FACHB-90]